MKDTSKARRRALLLAGTVLAAGMMLLAVAPASPDELRAGAAAVKITPPLGVSMAGYYSARRATEVHDDLFAKALVLEKDGKKAALVVLDLIRTHPEIVKLAREQIEKTTGLKGKDVMISATHTHTGPEIDSKSFRAKALGGAKSETVEYAQSLPRLIADAVRQAEAALTPVKVSAAVGHEDSVAFNRRYHMKDGTVGWNPGKLNPNVLKPAGTIDPEVPVVCFETPKKKSVAIYVNHAVHLDNVGGTQISADVPYTVSKCLAAVKGNEMVTLYTTGCCGDVNHVDVNWAEPQKGHENAARIGTILAAEALRTLPKLKAIEPDAIRARSEMVKLPLPKVTPDEVAKAREQTKSKKFLEQVNAFKALDVAARESKPLEVEVQVIALGRDIAWVSLPGEIFVEIGLAIKQDSLFPLTIIAELANGSIGYVPSSRAYPQGNYEVVSARCAQGSGEMLVATAVRLLREIHTASQ